MEVLKSADMNLLIDIRKQAIGTKIYDYIYVNRPVLYCGTKPTYLSDLVSGFKGGYVCTDEEQVIKAVTGIINDRKKTFTDEADTKTYSRTIQNRRMEELLKAND